MEAKLAGREGTVLQARGMLVGRFQSLGHFWGSADQIRRGDSRGKLAFAGSSPIVGSRTNCRAQSEGYAEDNPFNYICMILRASNCCALISLLYEAVGGRDQVVRANQ